MTREFDGLGLNARAAAEGAQDDYRQRVVALRGEAIKRREHELSEQRSLANSPADRIRIWERLHQLQLPRHDHQLLATVAVDTGLTLEDVRAEQQQRLAAKSGQRGD